MTSEVLLNMQKRAAALSQLRDTLSGLVYTLQVNVLKVQNASLPEMRRIARQIAKQHSELETLIREHPSLFKKPRSYIVDGLKFGVQKQPGAMTWESDEQLCKRIHALEGDGTLTKEEVAMLISTTEKPVSAALEKLDAKALKRLGVTVTSDTDKPLIKSVDGGVEKAVNAVIKEAIKQASEEATEGRAET